MSIALLARLSSGLLLLSSAPAFSQQVRFGNIGVADGLSQSTVTAIAQDRSGFLWIATEGGLNRYDGYRITTYRHEARDSSSISNSFIHALLVGGDGTLWVGTYGGGLNRYDAANDRFVRFSHPSVRLPDRIVTLLQSEDGSLWIGTEEGLFNLRGDSLRAFRHEPGNSRSPSGNNIRALAEGHDGSLWIGAEGSGLDRYDPRDGTFEHFTHSHADPTGLASDIFRSLLVSRDETLWIGAHGGLDRYDSSTKTFVHYPHDPADPLSLSDNEVSSILEDRDGRLWVATGRGLNVLENGRFTRYMADPARAESIGSNDLRTLFQDAGGILWIGSWDRGLIRKSESPFSLYRPVAADPNSSIGGFAEDASGNLWIGSYDDGVVYFDRASGTFTNYRHDPGDPSSLSQDGARIVYVDRTGTVWVGTGGGGVNRLQGRGFVRYREGGPRGLGSDHIRSAFEDREGSLWFNTFNASSCRYDRERDRFECLRDLLPEGVRPSNPNAYAAYQDPRGRYWISTWGIGIDVVDLDRGTVRAYAYDPDDTTALGYNSVTAFLEDSRGRLWIGTYGGGLNRYEPDGDRFIRYTMSDGLPDNIVYGLLEDDRGRLWLSTAGGLSRFDPVSVEFHNYDARDGLQSNEFNGGSFLKLRSGEMVFGGTNGFNIFHPDSVRTSSFIPPIVLTSFRVLEKERNVDPRELRLGYRENFISFEFAALDFSHPEKNRYAYMLEGLDDAWVYSEQRRFASYPGLRPGRYVLRVKGTNSDGVWNEAGLALPIYIVPPFWMTVWFRVAVMILAVIAVAAAARYVSIRKLQARLRKLETEHRILAERERISRDLHDQVGASLTKIAILSELAGRGVDTDREGHVSKISMTARGAIDEISEIIWAFNPRNDTIDNLVAYLRAHLAEYFESTPVACRFAIPEHLPNLHVSSEMRRNVLMVMKEAAQNIVKHARAGHAFFRFSVDGDRFEAVVEDDGIGFEMPSQSTTRNDFGNGLINMRRRIEELGGTFTIASVRGRGTTLRIGLTVGERITTSMR